MYYGRNCSSLPIPCVRLGLCDWILAYGRWVSVMQAGVRGSLLRHFLLPSHLLLLGHSDLGDYRTDGWATRWRRATQHASGFDRLASTLIVLVTEILGYICYLPGGSDGKESACSAGEPDSIPGLGRSPGEGNVNPLQYFCLENSMDRGAWQATYCPGSRKESDPTEWLSLTHSHNTIHTI